VAEKIGSVVRSTDGDGPTPLVYVDGVRVPDGIPPLDPDQVSRIEVLKGAVAVAAFGQEAGGGVIQIYTKDAHAEPASPGGHGVLKSRDDLAAAKLQSVKEDAVAKHGAIRSMESARIFVDGELFEGDVTAIKKQDIERVDVLKVRDGREVHITLKKRGS
jgi:hypothetical protein